MPKLLQRFVEPPRACSYLPRRDASLEVRVVAGATPGELEGMLERGWRRFGLVYFRPACASCTECVTLRILVDDFSPSKSQRRALAKARELTRIVGPAVADDERLELHQRWHRARERARGWEPSEVDAERYALDFALPQPGAFEVAFRDPRDGDRLVALGICDETPNALSAAYFFWDPEHAQSSLGVAHVTSLVAQARASGKAHVYLGYRVEGCASLAYKARYRPHELLVGRPSHDATPLWVRARDPASGEHER